MVKWRVVINFLICSCLLTSCWDRIEIDERGFVIGMAIDLAESASEDNEGSSGKTFSVTYQFVNPEGLHNKGGGSKSSEHSSTNAYYNVSSEGDTMFEIDRTISAKVSRFPYFEHLKTIIISEDVAKSRWFPNVLDYFIRDSEMRKRITIIISEGKAKHIMDIEPRQEKTPIHYIQSIGENDYKLSRIAPKSRIGDIYEQLLMEQSFYVQKIELDKKEVKLEGAAVFQAKQNKLVGYLNGLETSGLNFMAGEVRGGVVKFNFHGGFFNYEIMRIKRKLHVDVQNPQRPKAKFTLYTVGLLGEALQMERFEDQKVLKELERKVSEQLEKAIRSTITKVQKEYNVDVLGVGKYLSKKNPSVWKQIVKDWEEGERIFEKCDIDVEVTAIIRTIGTINQSDRQSVKHDEGG